MTDVSHITYSTNGMTMHIIVMCMMLGVGPIQNCRAVENNKLVKEEIC